MDTLEQTDERRLLDSIKTAVDLVDKDGLDPGAAIEKIARAEQFGPGMIRLMSHAYNTGRQTSQWSANTSILDKLASFEMADPEKVISAMYPSCADTPKEKAEKHAVDDDYQRPPDWLMDRQRRTVAERVVPMEKAAEAVMAPVVDVPRHQRLAYGQWERAKHAAEEARRHASELNNQLRAHVADMNTYLKQADDRLPYAQIEHAAKTYFGGIALDFLKLAYDRARLREKTAKDVPIQKLPFNLEHKPFKIITAAIKTAQDLVTARRWHKEAQDLLNTVTEETYHPFGQAAGPNQSSPQPTSPEKQAFLLGSAAMGGAMATMLSRSLGDLPKTKSDLIEDELLALEDPQHQNEMRKIKAHAMLNSMLTDPDDPISSYDPDRVTEAFNEIASMTPRLAEQPAALRPILRRKLQGLTEPFEAKEMTEIEKGLTQSRAPGGGSIIRESILE